MSFNLIYKVDIVNNNLDKNWNKLELCKNLKLLKN